MTPAMLTAPWLKSIAKSARPTLARGGMKLWVEP
jgi:hypothetical protein